MAEDLVDELRGIHGDLGRRAQYLGLLLRLANREDGSARARASSARAPSAPSLSSRRSTQHLPLLPSTQNQALLTKNKVHVVTADSWYRASRTNDVWPGSDIPSAAFRSPPPAHLSPQKHDGAYELPICLRPQSQKIGIAAGGESTGASAEAGPAPATAAGVEVEERFGAPTTTTNPQPAPFHIIPIAPDAACTQPQPRRDERPRAASGMSPGADEESASKRRRVARACTSCRAKKSRVRRLWLGGLGLEAG